MAVGLGPVVVELVELGFFFFQAEDGIRDYKVTGVQTCALPIFAGNGRKRPGDNRDAFLVFFQLQGDRKSTRLNSSHLVISYAVFCLKKKKKDYNMTERVIINTPTTQFSTAIRRYDIARASATPI